jgi:hypothetical protein
MVAMVLLVTNLPSVSANEQLAPGTTSEARGPAPLGCQPRQTKRAERPLLAAGGARRRTAPQVARVRKDVMRGRGTVEVLEERRVRAFF